MRVPVYDAETMEPLTVVHLSGAQVALAERCGGRLRIAVRSPMAMWPTKPEELPQHMDLMAHVVELRFERLSRAGRPSGWLVTTTTPENALLLEATFTPGRVGELQRRVQRPLCLRAW